MTSSSKVRPAKPAKGRNILVPAVAGHLDDGDGVRRLHARDKLCHRFQGVRVVKVVDDDLPSVHLQQIEAPRVLAELGRKGTQGGADRLQRYLLGDSGCRGGLGVGDVDPDQSLQGRRDLLGQDDRRRLLPR